MTSDMQVMFSPCITFRNYLKSTQHYASDNLVMKQKSHFFMWLFYAAVSVHLHSIKSKIIGWLYLNDQEGIWGMQSWHIFKTPSLRKYHEKSVRIASAWPKLETSTSQMYYHHAISLGGTQILIWFRKCIIF